jgi:hypothetical protein
MKTLSSLLILFSIQAQALPTETIVSLNQQRLTFCQYYTWDQHLNQLCGGTETGALNVSEKKMKSDIEGQFVTFVSSLMDGPTYNDDLAALDQMYKTADADTKTTLQMIAWKLNQTWLNRYENAIDKWLAGAPQETQDRLTVGWVAYAAVFAASPRLGMVPSLQRVVASRLPWSAVAVAVGTTASYYGYKAMQEKAPRIPTPPFELLTFADNSNPENDGKAKWELDEFTKKRDLMANDAGILAFFAAGPSMQIATAEVNTAKGFFAMMSRTVVGMRVFVGRAFMATRITPLSFIAGFVIQKIVSLTMDIERTVELSHQFVTLDETAPNAGQELSISLNGLHFMYLDEADRDVQNTEKVIESVLDSDMPNDIIHNNILERAGAYNYYLTTQPRESNFNVYLNGLQRTYEKLDAKIDEFVEFLSPMTENTSPLKAGIVSRRIAALREQQKEIRERRANFPREQIRAKILEVFKNTGGLRAK